MALFLAGGVRSRCKEIFGPFSAQPIFTTSKVFFCFPTLPPTFFFLHSSPFPFWRSNWKWALFLVSFPPSLFCEWVKEATGPGKLLCINQLPPLLRTTLRWCVEAPKMRREKQSQRGVSRRDALLYVCSIWVFSALPWLLFSSLVSIIAREAIPSPLFSSSRSRIPNKRRRKKEEEVRCSRVPLFFSSSPYGGGIVACCLVWGKQGGGGEGDSADGSESVRGPVGIAGARGKKEGAPRLRTGDEYRVWDSPHL